MYKEKVYILQGTNKIAEPLVVNFVLVYVSIYYEHCISMMLNNRCTFQLYEHFIQYEFYEDKDIFDYSIINNFYLQLHKIKKVRNLYIFPNTKFGFSSFGFILKDIFFWFRIQNQNIVEWNININLLVLDSTV